LLSFWPVHSAHGRAGAPSLRKEEEGKGGKGGGEEKERRKKRRRRRKRKKNTTTPDLWYFCDSSPKGLRQHKQEVKIISGKIYHLNDLTPS